MKGLVIAIFVLSALLAGLAIFSIVVATAMKRRMCIWVDRYGDVQIIANGSLGGIARDTRMVHLFLMRKVAASQSISKKVIDGRFDKEDYEFGLTDVEDA